jgi:hypothetical protein
MWRFGNFRFLLLVMGLATCAMLLEVTDDSRLEERELPHPYIMSRLYPERGESLLYRGIHAAYVERDLPQARTLFEQAIATGLKTEEDLFYRYAQVLVELDAPEEDVAAAVALWKRHYPFSDLPDPREMADDSHVNALRRPEGPGIIPDQGGRAVRTAQE